MGSLPLNHVCHHLRSVASYWDDSCKWSCARYCPAERFQRRSDMAQSRSSKIHACIESLSCASAQYNDRGRFLRQHTGYMVTASVLVEVDLALGAWLRDRPHLLGGQLLLFLLLLQSQLCLILITGHVLMHGSLAGDAVAVVAYLATEDVAIVPRGHEATPAAIGRGTSTVFLISRKTLFRRFVEPPGTRQLRQRTLQRHASRTSRRWGAQSSCRAS